MKTEICPKGSYFTRWIEYWIITDLLGTFRKLENLFYIIRLAFTYCRLWWKTDVSPEAETYKGSAILEAFGVVLQLLCGAKWSIGHLSVA